MDWLFQHNLLLLLAEILQMGTTYLSLSPFTSIFTPTSPFSWPQISYLESAT